MKRVLLTLVVAVALVTAGCLGSPGGTQDPETPTATPTSASTDATPTGTDRTSSTTTGANTPTGTSSPPTDAEVSVVYTVGAGDLPDEVESVEVTVAVVFSAHDDGRCWRDTFLGPYKPTITPLKVPDEEDCHTAETVRLDLADLDGNRSLGPVSAPADYDAGHALVVTDVTATYENGTTVERLRGAGGVRANVVWGRPDDSYNVVFRMDADEDRPYRYWLYSEVPEEGG